MILANIFQTAWKCLEIEYSNSPLETYSDEPNKNQAILVTAFCKFFDAGSNHLHAVYDARDLPDKAYRPNFLVWNDLHDGEPEIVFIGEIQYEHQDLSGFRQKIPSLVACTRKRCLDVLTRHDTTESMKVSPTVESGYLAVGDFDAESIDQEIAKLSLSPPDFARFHIGYGALMPNPRFEFRKSVLTGVNQ